jgi:hypothetical protein
VKVRLLIVALILASTCAAASALQNETLLDGKLSDWRRRSRKWKRD